MAIYRLSVLDGKGHVVDVYEAECSSDEEAYAKADWLANDRAIDIWQGSRWIALVDGSDPTRIALTHHVAGPH